MLIASKVAASGKHVACMWHACGMHAACMWHACGMHVATKKILVLRHGAGLGITSLMPGYAKSYSERERCAPSSQEVTCCYWAIRCWLPPRPGSWRLKHSCCAPGVAIESPEICSATRQADMQTDDQTLGYSFDRGVQVLICQLLSHFVSYGAVKSFGNLDPHESGSPLRRR